MAVIAQRAVDARTGAAARRAGATPRARVRRRPRSRVRKLTTFVLSAVVLAFLFGYVSVYAGLAKEGFNRSDLMEEQRQATLANQRLKVEMESLCSPYKIVAAAEQSGMVYATEYDYANGPAKVASAAGGGN